MCAPGWLDKKPNKRNLQPELQRNSHSEPRSRLLFREIGVPDEEVQPMLKALQAGIVMLWDMGGP